MYHQSRGRELPGNYNHSLLQRLFHSQSSRWEHISRHHVDSVVNLVSRFTESALAFVVKDINVRGNLLRSVLNLLNENAQNAYTELERLIRDEQSHPVTYNHYYTDNIQKARQSDAKAQIKRSVDNATQNEWGGRFHFTNSSDEMNRMVIALQERVEVNMVDRACYEALTDLNAYYKVSIFIMKSNSC